MSTHAMEAALESSLRQLIAAHRRAAGGLSTEWDRGLSFLLSPALAAYEAERVLGAAAGAAGQAEFQQSVRRAVPEGHTFKGFPAHFSHVAAPRMFADMMRAPVAAEMVGLRGGADSVRFALRAQVMAYPERVCGVWVMLAVVYAKVAPRGAAA